MRVHSIQHVSWFSFPPRDNKSKVAVATGVTLLLFCILLLSGGSTHKEVHANPSNNTPVAQVFQGIYKEYLWGNHGNGSGEGSTLEATKRTRLIIELLVARYGISSMLDAPCGAMAWMPIAIERVQSFNPDFRYCGVDVVKSVIEKNNKLAKKLKNVEFSTVDFAQDALPTGYQLIWSRDALQHLSYELIFLALEKFALSDAEYVVLGSYKKGDNRNIKNGDYFSIDLRAWPFKLDKPIDIIEEETVDEKVLLVFTTAYLKSQDFASMRQRAAI